MLNCVPISYARFVVGFNVDERSDSGYVAVFILFHTFDETLYACCVSKMSRSYFVTVHEPLNFQKVKGWGRCRNSDMMTLPDTDG